MSCSNYCVIDSIFLVCCCVVIKAIYNVMDWKIFIDEYSGRTIMQKTHENNQQQMASKIQSFLLLRYLITFEIKLSLMLHNKKMHTKGVTKNKHRHATTKVYFSFFFKAESNSHRLENWVNKSQNLVLKTKIKISFVTIVFLKLP